MTIHLSSLGQVYLVCGKTDMRQGIDSLAYLIKTHFELDPFSDQVFLFCGGRKDRFKALYWDGQGFWLLYNFENGKLTWPSTEKGCQSSHTRTSRLADEGLFYHSPNKFIRKS
ncbi:IS66 family insertion sequence element accessory protein TnpB [Streptococcus pseudopneumoniae]|nr:IS66 family insertion sequence element accessory protein TnpB [Streptococcus pseudopneumoniae]